MYIYMGGLKPPTRFILSVFFFSVSRPFCFKLRIVKQLRNPGNRFFLSRFFLDLKGIFFSGDERRPFFFYGGFHHSESRSVQHNWKVGTTWRAMPVSKKLVTST